MKPIALAALIACSAPGGVWAQDMAASDLQTTDALPADEMTPLERWLADPSTVFDGADVALEDFLWQARPIVVFADSPLDPNFRQQMEYLAARADDLVERDVLIVTDTDPGTPSSVRLRLRPRGFMLALIGKDGEVKLRKPLPWDVRELTRSIDKMPLRQQEIRDRRGG